MLHLMAWISPPWARFRPGRGGQTDGWMDRRTNGRMGRNSPCYTGLRPLWGCCPKTQKFQFYLKDTSQNDCCILSNYKKISGLCAENRDQCSLIRKIPIQEIDQIFPVFLSFIALMMSIIPATTLGGNYGLTTDCLHGDNPKSDSSAETWWKECFFWATKLAAWKAEIFELIKCIPKLRAIALLVFFFIQSSL